MTAKEKAQELIDTIYNLQSSITWDTSNENKEKAAIFNDELGADVELYWHELAKQSALFAVDEIIDIAYWEYMESMGEQEEKYWQEVKQEILITFKSE
jgi:hypothetical protein